MKKNRKGFTLIELLAVIVVLGLIMTIAGTAILKQKKKANIEEAVKIEQSIKDLGPNIYSYEYLTGNKTDANYFYSKYKSLGEGSSLKISLVKLNAAGYLKTGAVSNPAGNGNCEGYLVVTKKSSAEVGRTEPEFKGYINCPNLYATGQCDGKSDEDCKKSTYNNGDYNTNLGSITDEANLTNE